MGISRNRRSCCPVACTLDLIGDRWTLLVVRDLFVGKTRFSEFESSPESIATNILADRLGLLAERGLVEKRALVGTRGSSYHLTEKGKSLRSVLRALRDWGLSNIEGTEVRIDVGQ